MSVKLTDLQDKYKGELTGPYPEPQKPVEKARQYYVNRIALGIGESASVETAYEPDAWHVYCRRGDSADGFFVAPEGPGGTSVWQQADKRIVVPGRGNRLTVTSDAAAVLDMYIVALTNEPFDVS